MAVGDATRKAALAVHRRALRVHQQESRHVELAMLRRLKPTVQAELFESHDTLELGENLRFTNYLRWWDANYGLFANDVLVVVEMSDSTWLALAVVSERDAGAGIRPLKPPATPGAGGAHAALDSSTEVGLISATSSAVPSGGGTPTITLTWSHHIVKKMEVYDAAGARIGWVPVFQDLG